MSDYIPIDCERHSELELAILQRRQLRISWRDADGAAHLDSVTPIDTETTAEREEFLHVRDAAGVTTRIRLDRIVAITPT